MASDAADVWGEYAPPGRSLSGGRERRTLFAVVLAAAFGTLAAAASADNPLELLAEAGLEAMAARPDRRFPPPAGLT